MSTFACAYCKGVFEKITPDSEALAEMEQNFPGADPNDVDTICDECYQRLMKWHLQ